MKNKWIVFCILSALVLTGCGSQAEQAETTVPETTAHTHVAGEAFDWNGTEHWHLCACGEKVDAAAHKVNDELQCTDCGVTVWDMGDGTVEIDSYDQYGNPLKSIYFDAEGNVLSSTEFNYVLDEQGNILRSEYFVDGVLQSLDEYLLNDDGTTRIFSSSHFSEGCVDYNEYDEIGNLVYAYHTDSEGNITHESWTEYTCNDEGEYYESRCVEIYEGEKLVAEYNQYEDITLREWYDAAGNLTSTDHWEYGYNEDGDMEWMKEYRDGVLVSEITSYAETHGEDYSMRYAETVIEYNEDGTKIVFFHGTNGQVETETHYRADGSVDYVLRYAYETFEDGNWKSISIYKNDALIEYTEYVQNPEDGWSYKGTTTRYHDDGTKTVITYDEYEEIVTEITYDANGNEI